MQPLEFLPKHEYMQLALALAKEAAQCGEIPVGAVIEKDGIVIGTGRNRREEKQNALWHAEIEAIHNACKYLKSWRLSDCRLYVTLSPCVMCAGAIVNARIDRVIYGEEDDKLPISALEVYQKENLGTVKIYRNFMQEECKTLLSDFFKKIR